MQLCFLFIRWCSHLIFEILRDLIAAWEVNQRTFQRTLSGKLVRRLAKLRLCHDVDPFLQVLRLVSLLLAKDHDLVNSQIGYGLHHRVIHRCPSDERATIRGFLFAWKLSCGPINTAHQRIQVLYLMDWTHDCGRLLFQVKRRSWLCIKSMHCLSCIQSHLSLLSLWARILSWILRVGRLILGQRVPFVQHDSLCCNWKFKVFLESFWAFLAFLRFVFCIAGRIIPAMRVLTRTLFCHRYFLFTVLDKSVENGTFTTACDLVKFSRVNLVNINLNHSVLSFDVIL